MTCETDSGTRKGSEDGLCQVDLTVTGGSYMSQLRAQGLDPITHPLPSLFSFLVVEPPTA